VKEAISLDSLAEMVINTINSLQNEKIQNIEDLFHAADMSATGVISYDEFRTLYKLIVI
jgi:Ca2+-binding EF-hand superfamily protein